MDKQLDSFLSKFNKQTPTFNQEIARESSLLIPDFIEKSNLNLNNQSLSEKICDKTIPDLPNDDDLPILNEILANQKFEITKDNYAASLKIGRNFLMKNTVEQCTMFQKFEMLNNFLDNDNNFQILLKSEKIFLEMNEDNIDDTFNQCIDILSSMPLDCFYNFIIHVFLFSNKCHQKFNLLIQLLEKIEGHITGIILLFIQYILNNTYFKKPSQKTPNYKARINSFVYELCTKVNVIFLNKDISIFYSNFCVPEIFSKIFIFDKNKQRIRINKDINIDQKSNLGNSLVCSEKEINETFQGKSGKRDNSNISDNIKNIDNVFSFKISILLDSIQRDDLDFLQNSFQEFENNLFISPLNQSCNCSLLEYSAFFGAMKCFQFLLNNNKNLNQKHLPLYATAGGNTDIIHLCERYNCVFDLVSLQIAIIFHQHFIAKWLIETKHIEPNQHILKRSIKSYNIRTLYYLINRKILINRILLDSISAGNSILFRSMIDLEFKNIGFSFDYNDSFKTALHIACKQNNVEIVKLLLTKENLDINAFSEVK